MAHDQQRPLSISYIRVDADDRRLSAALHFRDLHARWQHVVSTSVGDRRRVAGNRCVLQLLAALFLKHVNLTDRWHGDFVRQHIGGAHQEFSHVMRAVRQWIAFPIIRRGLARTQARKILLNITAANRIFPIQRGDDPSACSGSAGKT